MPKEDTEVFAAVRLVSAAGGVPVFAHPRATRRGRVLPDDLIIDLAAAGLFGLEADHVDRSPAERAHGRWRPRSARSSPGRPTSTVRTRRCDWAPRPRRRRCSSGSWPPRPE